MPKQLSFVASTFSMIVLLGCSPPAYVHRAPTRVQGLLEPLVELSGKGAGFCGRSARGEVTCWGANYTGSCAEGTCLPHVVTGVSAHTRITYGEDHTCTYTTPAGEDVVECWGSNSSGQLGTFETTDGTPVIGMDPKLYYGTHVVASQGATCAIESDAPHSIVCVGAGITTMPVGQWHMTQERPEFVAPVALDVGDQDDLCAVHDGGHAACWHRNEGLHAFDGIDDAVEVAVGVASVCVLREGGRVSCGPLFGSSLRELSMPPAAQVVVGDDFACARLVSGGVTCWADSYLGNYYGQLGANGSDDHLERPTGIPGLNDVVDLAASSDSVCALHADGSVVCWGSNCRAALGIGTQEC